jgi:YbgC/YbaW family acyl-CoA thioester hydrolase
MPYEFTFSHRVEFAETDMAGIVHFANFYRMMENAEHAFFRSLGFSIHGHFDGMAIGWPRVSATCEFFKPLRFEETVEIQLIVAEVRTRSIRYAFRFWKNEDGARSEIARGSVVTVCANLDRSNGKMAAVPVPAAVLAVIQPAPAEMLAELSLQTTSRPRPESRAEASVGRP